MTPREKYHAAIEQGHLVPDDAQAIAVSQLDNLYHRLIDSGKSKFRFTGLFRRGKNIPGLYLWGGTGRGKTQLMDTFYSCLNFTDKNRLHFHRFMRDVHAQIRDLSHVSEPLKVIAKRWAQQYRLLCLDEFHVTDITDAMILARLLEGLFANGVTLVTTSNIAIDELYKDGLQRQSFLPAIQLLHEYTAEVMLGQGTD